MHSPLYLHIGHLWLTVTANHDAIRGRIARWLADFAAPAVPDGAGAAITLTLLGYADRAEMPVAVPDGARQTFQNSTATYYEHEHLWYSDFGDLGLVVVDRAAGRMTGYVQEHRFLSSELAFEDFMHPLYELMRGHGLYPHHAAAVSLQGRGLLLVGKSGQGKSTLSADLIHHGFDFLCDDRCFVRQAGGGFEVLAFYEPFKLFAVNVAHIPAAAGLAVGPKRPLDIRAAYPSQAKLSSPLTGILFPQWAPGERSRLEPLPPGQALVDLLPLTMVCFDPASARAHFAFAGQVAQQAPAARLVLGGDRESWHRLAQQFLAEPRGE